MYLPFQNETHSKSEKNERNQSSNTFNVPPEASPGIIPTFTPLPKSNNMKVIYIKSVFTLSNQDILEVEELNNWDKLVHFDNFEGNIQQTEAVEAFLR